MPHRSVSSRPSFRRIFAQAVVISLIPIGTAFAQSASYVSITRDNTPIKAFRLVDGPTLMTAATGTLLEVVHTRGDLYVDRDDNWYWVLLPGDSWGTQRLGWVSGRDVESAPGPPRRVVAVPETTITPVARVREEASAPVAPVASAPIVATNKPAEPVVSEVVLHFAFAKSELTAEAKSQLNSAVEKLKGGSGTLSVALEGHADWTGPESFNDKLGMARAEAVKRHLAEQHQIPVTRIDVVSHGENKPAAPNETKEGRAQNRRVVVKVAS